MRAARQMWMRLESIHAVTYFSPEARTAAAEAGLKGFWMGYFGFRAAPLGPVGPAVVGATFANFAPAMVERSIPDAWAFAEVDSLIEARRSSAAAVLRRVSPSIEAAAEVVNGPLRRVVAAGGPAGRPLFAANAALDPVEDPVEELWQLCTTLREHRGDGHVIALAAAGIDGCEAHCLQVVVHGVPSAVLLDNRGWTHVEWEEAGERLRERGALTSTGSAAQLGLALLDGVEEMTDRLAGAPYDTALTRDERAELLAALTSAATEVARSGVLPFPNPMGLPPLADENHPGDA